MQKLRFQKFSELFKTAYEAAKNIVDLHEVFYTNTVKSLV